MEEIAAYDAELMIDLYLEAKLGKVDVIAELPDDLKTAIVRLQWWIDGYGTSEGGASMAFGIAWSAKGFFKVVFQAFGLLVDNLCYYNLNENNRKES